MARAIPKAQKNFHTPAFFSPAHVSERPRSQRLASSDCPSSPVPSVLRTLAARPRPSSASATPPRARPLACAAPCRQESAEHPASRRRALANLPQQPLPPARTDLVGAWGIVARFCVNGRSIQARTSPSLQPRRSSVRCLRELRELVLFFA